MGVDPRRLCGDPAGRSRLNWGRTLGQSGDDKDWYRRNTISTWRRVGVAATVLVISLYLPSLLAASGQRFLGMAAFILITAPAFLFLFGSLSITLMYKLSGGFSRSDWMFGETNLMRFLIIREVIK